ncbi:MAG: hypothetical protein ABS44_17275 [Chryseobacterium sp. SCN 40-13]|nr:MAG: hypothetical protein ABS44_17275 [Chryseobacterium sp. SCN 40-13]
MKQLKQKLAALENPKEDSIQMLARLKMELTEIEGKITGAENSPSFDITELKDIESQMSILRNRLLERTG